MVVDYREQVVSFIRSRGPVVPTQVGKHMGMNSMLAGAMLSEMVSKGAVQITKMKLGGSPLYYVQGQEQELTKFTEYLDEKDRQTVNMLQEKKVLRESACSPLVRVSLKNLPDFAQPLDVTFNDAKETFWKWRFLSEEETEQAIRGILQPKKSAAVATEVRVAEETMPSAIKQEGHKKPETQHKAGTGEDVKAATQTQLKPKQGKGHPAADSFLTSLHAFFSQNNIKIVEQQCIRKKGEYDFVLSVPSCVGELIYYCKAKSKTRVSEADLSAAYVQGQLRKLPVLMLSPGELAKKAKELVTKDLKGITFKQMRD